MAAYGGLSLIDIDLQIQELQRKREKIETETKLATAQQMRSFIDRFKQTVHDYNTEMDRFIARDDPFFNTRFFTIHETNVKMFADKDRTLSEYEFLCATLTDDLRKYRSSQELSQNRPELFIDPKRLSDEITKLEHRFKKYSGYAQTLRLQLDQAADYQAWKKDPFAFDKALRLRVAKSFWDHGERPNDFERNTKMIRENYRNFPKIFCENCQRDITIYRLPKFEFGDKFDIPSIYSSEDHSTSSSFSAYWQCNQTHQYD